jgi:hypothetical protein
VQRLETLSRLSSSSGCSGAWFFPSWSVDFLGLVVTEDHLFQRGHRVCSVSQIMSQQGYGPLNGQEENWANLQKLRSTHLGIKLSEPLSELRGPTCLNLWVIHIKQVLEPWTMLTSKVPFMALPSVECSLAAEFAGNQPCHMETAEVSLLPR